MSFKRIGQKIAAGFTMAVMLYGDFSLFRGRNWKSNCRKSKGSRIGHSNYKFGICAV